jgi:hypothetical protein
MKAQNLIPRVPDYMDKISQTNWELSFNGVPQSAMCIISQYYRTQIMREAQRCFRYLELVQHRYLEPETN